MVDGVTVVEWEKRVLHEFYFWELREVIYHTGVLCLEKESGIRERGMDSG